MTRGLFRAGFAAVIVLLAADLAASAQVPSRDPVLSAIGKAVQRHDLAALRSLERRVLDEGSSSDRNVYVAARGALDVSYHATFISRFPTDSHSLAYDLGYIYPSVTGVARWSAFEVLVRYARAKDPKAIRKLMQVMPHTDGATAELLSDELAMVVNANPHLALSAVASLREGDKVSILNRSEVWCQASEAIRRTTNVSGAAAEARRVILSRAASCPASYR